MFQRGHHELEAQFRLDEYTKAQQALGNHEEPQSPPVSMTAWAAIERDRRERWGRK